MAIADYLRAKILDVATFQRTQSNERRFGIAFAVLVLCVALYGFIRNWPGVVVLTWFSIGIGMAQITLWCSRVLAPLSRGWTLLGHWIGRVTMPIILGVIFFCVLSPVALVARVAGRDELRLRRKIVDSYWIFRAPPEIDECSFRRPF